MFKLTKPCPGCPFGTGEKSVRFLGKARAEEIRDGLLKDGHFLCHQTTHFDDDDEDGDYYFARGPHGAYEQQCVGSMILLERIDRPNQMMRIGERVGMYDPSKLDLKTKAIVENFHEFVAVQSAPPSRRSAPPPEELTTKQEK